MKAYLWFLKQNLSFWREILHIPANVSWVEIYIVYRMHITEYLCNMFSRPSHQHNTRYSATNNLKTAKCKLHTGQRAFSYRGALAWNSLSVTTRQAQTLTAFKGCLIKEIMTKRAIWFHKWPHIHCFCFILLVFYVSCLVVLWVL